MSRLIRSPRMAALALAVPLVFGAPLIFGPGSVCGDEPLDPSPATPSVESPDSLERPEPADRPENPSESLARVEKAWGIRLMPIDRWMRMHLLIPPHLAPAGQPLLVESVAAGSLAEAWRIQPGDVILESDRGPVRGVEQIGAPTEVQYFRILRRGEPSIVHRKPWQDGAFAGPPMGGMAIPGDLSVPMGIAPPWGPTGPMIPSRPGIPMSSHASVSTESSHGSAVAISQAGSRIQIEVSENGEQVRLSGDVDSIRQQIRDSKLSPGTTEKIEAALRRIESYR